ncbi:hypothetical protein D9M71_228890 [compost metagenome]
MAAGVHHRLRGVVQPGRDLGALVGQARGLLDRQGIHVGAVHHHRTGAVAQDTDHPGGADGGLDLEALLLQGLGHQRGGFLLLESQFRVAVQLFEHLDHLRFVLFDQRVDTGFQVGLRSLCAKGTETGEGEEAGAVT